MVFALLFGSIGGLQVSGEEARHQVQESGADESSRAESAAGTEMSCHSPGVLILVPVHPNEMQ